MHYLTLNKLRITLLIGVLLSCFAVQAQVAVPFTPRKQVSIKGDITMIGNNIVNRKTEGSRRRPAREPNDAYPFNSDENSSTANDDFNMRYIDIDGDGTTFSSSKATLTVPDASCSKVVYAALYWSATYRYNNSDDSGGPRSAINAIKLKLPNATAYTAITGTILHDGFTGMFPANGAYACYADVTTLVSGLTNPNGEYTVADIRATQGDFGGGVSGGWNLFVIYENPTYPGKYITSYDGFAGVNAALGSVDVPYSGFVTVPSPLPVRAKLAAAALEGDNQISGDQLLFRGGAATNAFNQLSNTKNPATNFFNSNITYLDAAGVAQDFIARTPNSGNTLGFDSDIISIPTGYLPNGATQATLQIKSTQDTYYMFFNALSVDIIEPEMRLVKTVQDIQGHDIGGGDVTLGQPLDYVIKFKNIGNDNAKGFTIRDVLPENTFYQNIDVSGAPGVTGVYNATTKEIVFTIPDDKVKTTDVEYTIRIRVNVVNTCSELTDACSNIIQNLAYSTYRGVLNNNQISNDPSVAGVDTCGASVQGPANFLVDIDECAFVQNETLCGASITLTAGNGYASYQWYRIAGGVDTPAGNTQSITVNAPGNYKVVNTPTAPCIGITQYFNVTPYSTNAVSPVKLFADEEVECTNDGDKLGKIFLCGINDHRLLQTNISNAQSIIWEKLTEGSCTPIGLDNCANKNAACTWVQVATGQNFDVTQAGQYRLVVNYQTGGCFNRFYFNVFKNISDPQVAVKNIICTTDGEIRVLNIPSTYEIKLIKVVGATETIIVNYPNTNPVFPVSATGIYRVEIKQTGVPNGCIFKLDNIGIQKKDLATNIITTNKTCSVFGSITLQAINVEAQYSYRVTNGTVNRVFGPTADASHEFTGLDAGAYTVYITTEDGCSFTGTATVNDYSTLALNAAVKQSISCDPGQIQLTPSGGLEPYIYAIYSKNGVLQNPGVGDYTLGNPVEIVVADAGTYEFITKDANGCTVVSNSVTISNVPGVTYTTTTQNVTCNGANNGTFTFNTTATNGYGVSYEVIDADDDIVGQNTTGIFTGLAPGTYTANLIQTGTTNTCNFSTTFTITQPAALTGTASITQAYTCATGGATITVNVPSVTGGTTPYEYSIDGTAFGSATTFTGLTAGTYRVTIKDAKGCTLQTAPMTVAPLTPVTNITFSGSAVMCPSQTSNVTLTVGGGVGPFNYQIILPSAVNNGTSAVFNNLAPDTYTFRVTDANGCTLERTHTVNPITPIAVTGINDTNVICFGTATGALIYTVTGFGTSYNYSVVSTGTAIPAATGVTSGTISLTNLSAGTYTITVTNTATNCQATAAVTITAPSAALSISKAVTQPTCNAQGSVVITATGGWGSNEYELTFGTTVLTNNNGTFSALMPGNYSIKVTDGNECPVTDTFTLTGAVAPVLTIDPSSDLCYDTTNQASLTALIASGTGTAPFSYKINNGPAQTSATFAGLNAGTYTISVTDGNNCTGSVTKTIYPQMVASAVLVKDQDCSASPAAQIRINIAGGATPYTYAVSVNGAAYSDLGAPSANPLIYTTSTAGTYRFKYTDANGCSAETPATIVSPLTQPLITSLTPTDATCFGSSNGAIAVVINNTQGLSPYVISVTKTSGTTVNYGTQTTGLPAGNYSVTITDANGCTSLPVTTIIAQPDEITYVINKVDISCNNPGGTSFGQIMIQGLSGGTAPYTYYTTNNFGDSLPPYVAPTGEDYSFVILNFGIYKVEVVDANGCSVIVDNITIASPPDDLTIDVAAVTTDCTTGGTAVVTVSAAVVSNNYEFGILTSNTMPYSSAYFPSDSGTPLTRTFTGLTPGVTYTFVVHDLATGCYYFKSAASAVTSPSMVTASVIPKNVTCTNAADGKVSFVISGYNPATTQIKYEIFKSPSTLTTGITATVSGLTGTPYNVNNVGDLIPGDYYILLTELDGGIAGCSNTTSNFTITQSAVQLELAAEITKNDNCNSAAGIITASAKYGKSGYKYLLLPDNAIPPTAASFAGSTSPIFNADGGNYIVYVKDANDCIVDFPITLPTDSAPQMQPLTVTPACPTAEGTSTIAITTLPGGVAPFTFSLNGSAFQANTTMTYTNLSSGAYTVVMKDANGCTDTESVTIYAPLNIAPLAATQPTCVNNNGVIAVIGSGGSASANYNYELQTAAGVSLVASNTTGSFSNLAAGDYKVILTDTATPLCSKELLVTLEAPILVTFNTTQTNVSCNAGTDGTVTATLAPGNTDLVYTYSITNGTVTINNQGDGLFTNLAAGNWTVTVTSGKNCSETATVTITEPAALTVSAAVTTEFACATDNTVNTAVITVTATGGTGTKQYSINGTSYYTTNTFNVADTGADQNFTVYVKDANNCSETTTVTVNRLPAITAVDVDQTTAITCNNAETVTLTVTGGSGDFTFQLLPIGTQPALTPGAGVQTATFDLPSVGNYTFMVTDNVTGCSFTTAAYTIVPFDIIDVTALSATAVTCFGNTNGTITIEVSDYSGPYQYEVRNAANGLVVANRNDGNTSTNPFVVTNVPAGSYYVKIRANNAPFCAENSAFITVPGPAAALALTATPNTGVTCTNTKGEITAQATGGWGTYEYQLVNNTTPATIAFSANNVFTDLAAGNYTISARDSGGCIVTQTVNFILPANISADIALSAGTVACYGNTTASVEAINVTGGQGTYQYMLNTYDALGTTIVATTGAQVSPVFNGLGAGKYSISVIDGWDCGTVPTGIVTVTQPDQLEGILDVTAYPTCFTPAQLALSATGGSGTYEYSLDGINFNSTNTFTVFAGTYQYYVRDNNGCGPVLSNPVTINDVTPLAIDLNLAGAKINCADDTTAVIIAEATGGLGNYSYELVTGANVNVAGPQPSGTFSGLGAGDYIVRVTSGDCTASSVVPTIANPAEFVINPTVVNLLCFGDPSGKIIINTTGGTGTVQYAISPNLDQFVNDNEFDNLSAGVYDVIVQDQNGCFEFLHLTVTEPQPIVANIIILTNETCLGEGDGRVEVDITGGTGSYSYRVDYPNGSGEGVWQNFTAPPYIITGIAPGEIIINIKDQNECFLNPPIDQEILPGVDLQPTADVTANCVNNAPNNDVTVNINMGVDTNNVTYSIDGTTYVTSNVFTNVSLPAGNHIAYAKHTVPVTLLECIKTTPFTIDVHDPIVATAAVTQQVLCYGQSTGKITVTTTGGSSPLEFAIAVASVTPSYGTYQASGLFTGLAAGTYVVNVRDSINCDVTTTAVTITEPSSAVAATVAHTNEICIDANDGTITITPSGGVGPYQTSINGAAFATDLVYNNLADGTYTIDVKDANECAIVQQSVTITPGVFLDATVEVAPNCSNNIIGNAVFVRIDSSVTPADVTYALDGGTYQATEAFGDVPAGSHSISVLHVNGCEQIVTFTVDVLTPITATYIQENVLCNGLATGEITVTASGGTGTLSYAISDATPPVFVYDTPNVFSGLTAGIYTVSILDDNLNCEKQLTVTITEPVVALAATLAHTDETCFDSSNGTITITITGGTAPYETSLNGGTFSTATSYTALADGTYTIDVRDDNGCAVTQLTQIIQNGVDMQPSAAVTPNCVANTPNNDVVITIATGFAAGDVTYSIDGTTYQASSTFTNVGLAPNTYTAYVQHTNGCIQTAPFTIDVHTPITATAAVTENVLCFGGTTGEITVTATGGTTPLQYAISPAYAYGTANVFTGLTAGTYDVKVKDAISCEITTTSVTITEPAAALAATLAHTDETCFDASNGTITITITGGTAPYETSLNGGVFSTATLYTALADGTYTIDVRDDNGCAVTQLTQVIQNGVDMQPSAAVTPNCVANTPNNDVVITIATGFATGDVTYSIDGTNYQASNTFTNVGLAPNTYTAYAKHTNGCIQTALFTIDVHAPIAATAAVTANVLCFDGTTGEITVTATGGTTPLQYAISPAYVYGNANVFTGLAAGTYDVKVKDAISCEITTTSVTITEPAAALAATLAHTDETCFDASNGTITITITGGTAPYETSLNGGVFSTTTSYTALADGTYTIDVRDDNGCAVTQLTQVILNGVDMQPSAAVTPDCVANTPNNDVEITIATGFAFGDVSYSLDNVTYQPSNIFANVGLAPNTYIAYVKHTNGCIQTTPFTIDVHAPIAATAAVTANVLCNGSATGEITVTATGGTTPLQYAISPAYAYGTANVFTGLAAGTYDVKVKDAISCEITTTSVTITEPVAALAATLAHTDETCFDASNGTITITITGGTAPYETSLNGGVFSTTTSYTALADGTYTIDVRDDNGCAVTQLTQVILNGVDMQPSAAVTPNCVANTPNNDVEITIATGFASGDVTYSIDGTTYQASSTFTNVGLAPNTYTAYAKHTNGCIQTTPFTIDVHAPITATAAVTANVLCFGGTTGEITVTATGGTTPLQYAISPAYVYGTSNVFNGLTAGTYDVKVKDAISCEITTTSVTITEPVAALAATLAHTDETCFDASNGTITITITGGTAPYETSLNGGTFSTATSYTALADGTYTIDVRDDNGCAVTQLTQVILNGVDMQPSAAVTPNCVANTPNNDVVITIATGFGAGDVTYSIDGTTYQASNTFTNVGLAPNTYTAYAKHTNGCLQTVPFTIDLHAPIVASSAVTANVLCFGGTTGEITVTATGGTTPLQYAISPAYVYGTANVFTGLTAGTYDVKVKDAISCEITTTSVTITEPATAVSATVVHTDEICINANDGTITITPSGGVGSYQTSLNGAAFTTATTYLALADGTYTIDVKDANGCAIAQQSVTIAPGVFINATAEVVPNCDNNVIGNVVFMAVDASVTSNVTYSLDGGTYQSSEVFADVPVGAHTVSVLHTNGCEQLVPFTVILQTPITATYTQTDVLCNGAATGEITVSATGGTGTLSYSISAATPPVFSTYQASNIFSSLTAGIYTVSILDDNLNCEKQLTVTITEPAAALAATLAHTDETCFDSSNGTITITITGGTAPYETSLNGGVFSTATSYTALADGTYTIDVRDDNGCAITQLTQVILNGVDMQPLAAVTPNCVANTPNNDVVITIATGFATGDVTYSIDGTTYQASNTFNNVGLAPNTYTAYTKHTNGCIQTAPFTIDVHTPIAATAAVTANVLCNGSATGEITVTATGGTTPLQYAISPAYVYGTTNVFTGLAAGTYDVKVKDAISCEITTTSVTITEPAAALAATLAHTDETCFDASNGSITITITGGTAPYETSLNGGVFSTTTSYTALADGTYTIDVRDDNGCAVTQLTQVIQNGVDMQPSAAVTPNCVANTPNNDVVITIATGFAAGDVTYSIDGTNYQASNTFTNVGLAPNTYTAYAKHTNGCIQTAPFTIDVHAPIAAMAAVTANVLCNGSATGEITVTATGGTTPLQYAISPAYAYGTANVFTGLAAGTYDVKVKDAITCEVTTSAVTITQPATALTATLAHTDETCFDANNGSITVNVTGGTTPYEISLNGGVYTAATLYAALADGTYTIDVRDANGCAVTQLTQVIQNGVNMQPVATVTPNCANNVPNNTVIITIATGFAAGDVTYSIDGTNYQASNTFANTGLAVGTYTAYVKHTNGCIQTTSFTIDPHAPIMHTGTLTLNITCYGNNAGEATLSAIGGTGTLQYAMAPDYVYQLSNTFTGLAPGTYDFKIKDAIGCEIEVNDVTITEPFGPLAATLNHTDETCFNSNDGSITVNITGGSPPYFTSLDGGAYIQGQTVYTNLADGTHTINVTDAFACTIPQQSVVIVNGVNMQPVATVTPNCVNNAPDNNVVITIASGVTPSAVTYSIDGTNYQASNTFANTGLAAGTYTAYVKHANSCIQQTTFTIAPHAPVAASVASVAGVLCFGDASGQITVTATGGTTPLEYAVANENTNPLVYGAYQTSNVFTGLAAGTYTVSVRDAIGCEVVLQGNLVDGPTTALTALATPTHESCVNNDDGQIDITVNGGTAPYATSLNGATYVVGQLSYTNLDGGNYTVDVMDANGCHIDAPLAVTVNAGVQLQASLNVTQVCEDVRVVVNVNPTATGTVTYTLDGLYTQSSNTFNSGVTPMAAGQHTIAVAHSAGCTETIPFTVAPRIPIVINYNKTDVGCKDQDTGVIVVNATGGTGALQYAISFDISPTPVYTSNNTFDELLGDKDYTLYVKDAMGCIETTTLRITQPLQKLLIASTVVRPERCISERNGGIDITITGGTPPYLTALNSPSPNNLQPVTSYNNLIGGTYDVYVVDAAGCAVKTTVVVENGVNIDPYIETVTSCENNLPVNRVTVKLYRTVADVTYSLSPAGPFTANNVFELASGQHTVYIRHKNGCEKTLDFTIQDRLPVAAQVTPVAAKCNGEASGTITVRATGGTGAFKYAIADGNVTPVTFGNFQTSNVFTGLSASNAYIVRVEDAYGCFTEVNAIVIGQPDAIVLTAPTVIQEEVCVNDGDAAIELEEPTGGVAPYATSLSQAGPFVTDQYLFDNLKGGTTYTVYVQDANGCIATTSVTLAAPMDIDAKAEVEYNCDENTVTIVTNSNIPASQLSYIMTSPKESYPPQASNVYEKLENGTYTVEVINTVTGCSDTTEAFIIENATPLVLTVTKTGLNQITANAVGGTGTYRYSFDDYDNGTKNTYTYFRSGKIKVTVTDSRGCSKEAFVDVVFIDIIIPDVITPDGDGQNDVWSPGNTQNYPNINTDIFDRYGRKLATLKQGQTWDGKYDGNDMPTGDYWYLIKLGDAEDRDIVGHFTIYR